MKIIVCLKAVVDETKIEFDDNYNIKRETIELKPNSSDEFAIEQAIILKEKYGFETIALTMGPENAKEILKYAYSKGIEKTILISDTNLKGADCLITSKVLFSTIKKVINEEKDFLIFCGSSSDDSHTSVVPAQISYLLKIPYIPLTHILDIENKNIKAYTSYGILKTGIPSVFSFETNNKIHPRISPLNLRIKSKTHNPEILTLKDLDIEISAKQSPTYVIKMTQTKPEPKTTQIIDITNKEDLQKIINIIYG